MLGLRLGKLIHQTLATDLLCSALLEDGGEKGLICFYQHCFKQVEVISSSNGGLQAAAVQLPLVFPDSDSSHSLRGSSSMGGIEGALRRLRDSSTGPFSKILRSENFTFGNLSPGSGSIFLQLLFMSCLSGFYFFCLPVLI